MHKQAPRSSFIIYFSEQLHLHPFLSRSQRKARVYVIATMLILSAILQHSLMQLQVQDKLSCTTSTIGLTPHSLSKSRLKDFRWQSMSDRVQTPKLLGLF